MLNDAATTAAAPAPRPRMGTALTAKLAPNTMDVCDTCGEAQGFQVPGAPYLHECPGCATERMRSDLAREHLDTVVSPALGVWMAYWQNAGVDFQDLDDLFRNYTGADLAPKFEQEHREQLLRRVGEEQKGALEVQDTPPVRLVADPSTLPLIARRLPNPSPLRHSAFFTAGDKQQVHVLPGMDAVVLSLDGGLRAVIYLGSNIQEGFRCPPELWPDVAAELKYLPEDAS